MPTDEAEQIYQFAGLACIGIALAAAFWLHRGFNDDRLTADPQSLSDARLRRILSWGRVIHRLNSANPKGEQIMERMRLALEELRRRRTN